MKNFEIAINNALEIYAESAQITKQEAADSFRNSESTRDCIMLLVLAQADKAKLKKLAATFLT